MPPKKVLIGVLGHDRGSALARSLRSLQRVGNVETRVIVHLDAPTDDVARVAARSGYQTIGSSAHIGIGASLNALLRRREPGEAFCRLDGDTEVVTDEWLALMYERFFEDWGAVSTVYQTYDGLITRSLQHETRCIPMIIGRGAGAVMLIRPDALDALGGWREGRAYSLEDTDWYHRMARAESPAGIDLRVLAKECGPPVRKVWRAEGGRPDPAYNLERRKYLKEPRTVWRPLGADRSLPDAKIAVCMPSRGRPDRAAKAAQTAKRLAQGPIEVIMWIDDDDETAPEYRKLETDWLRVFSGPREVQSNLWNRCFAKSDAPLAMLAADDIVFISPGWDEMIRSAFEQYPDHIAMVFGDDGSRNKEATLPFVSREWIEIAGMFTPPYFKSWFADRWIWEVAEMIDRRVFLPRLRIEHQHPIYGKARKDATYLEAEQFRAEQQPQEIYFRPEMIAERAAQAVKLRRHILAAAEPEQVALAV